MMRPSKLSAILAIGSLGCLALAQSTHVPSGLGRKPALGTAFGPLAPDAAAKAGLKPGEGVTVAAAPVVGLTGDKLGLKPGDVVLSINGWTPTAQTLGAKVRELKSGEKVVFSILRDGKPMELSTELAEKPRDPGNENYTVIYSDITSHGKKMRTIITKPKGPRANATGKYPGFFFIQGFSPISYDFVMKDAKGDVAGLDGPLLHKFANEGFVTIRVEKPGTGDSEGGPFVDMDYHTEMDIYRQALLQLKAQPELDQDNVFIFGHSMGGAFGPMVASEIPVKGIATYGTAARTWFEYLMDTVRYQGLVGGETFEQADDGARMGARIMAQVFLENRSPADVKKSIPELAPVVDAYFPGGLFNGKGLEFWRQLNQINFAKYWANCKAHVLAIRGASDFVTYDADHKLIADIVNKVKPGYGTFKIVPNSDHLFHAFKTEPESMKNFQKGKFNIDCANVMMKWMREVMSKK